MEHLQKRACRTILGQRCASYADAIQISGLESLDDRRESHCVRFAEGLANSERTNDLLPPTRRESHTHNLRNAHHYSHLRYQDNSVQEQPNTLFYQLVEQVESLYAAY